MRAARAGEISANVTYSSDGGACPERSTSSIPATSESNDSSSSSPKPAPCNVMVISRACASPAATATARMPNSRIPR